MNTRHTLSRLMVAAAVAAVLLSGGCRTPATKPGSAAATPNFGPSVTDTRTEAVIRQMEIDYIAAKNSRPTYQHIAAAEKKAKEEAEAEVARKAAEERKD
jgi:hypothetical protein